jgi:hypothetical protein
VDAYAEIIATRPLGIVVYYCIPMDGEWREFGDYVPSPKCCGEDLKGTNSWLLVAILHDDQLIL